MSREEMLLFDAFESAVKASDDFLVSYIREKIRDHYRARRGGIFRLLDCLKF